MLKHELGRTELIAAVRTERLKLQQERLAHTREITRRQSLIDKVDERLRDLDHAEGMLR